MFKWLTRRFKVTKANPQPSSPPWLQKIVRPHAMALSIAECTADHFKNVKAAKIGSPAHRVENSTVQDVWVGLRYEAFGELLRMQYTGKANIAYLGDFLKQKEIFDGLVNALNSPEIHEPVQHDLTDTLQGVLRIYLYLNKVGREVAEPSIYNAPYDRNELRFILATFKAKIEENRQRWAAFDNAVISQHGKLPNQPLTAIEILWEDVTAKTKAIAFCTILGPDTGSTIKAIIKKIEEAEGSDRAREVQEYYRRCLAATEPEEMNRIGVTGAPESREANS